MFHTKVRSSLFDISPGIISISKIGFSITSSESYLLGINTVSSIKAVKLDGTARSLEKATVTIPTLLIRVIFGTGGSPGIKSYPSSCFFKD